MKNLLILVLTTCLGAAMAFAGDGLCIWERWDTQDGGVDAMLTRTTTPADSATLLKTEWGRDGVDPDLDEYLARITLWLIPEVTGNYQFRISTDDNARLWLSSDANPANAVQIAGYNGWADIDQWDKYSGQTSGTIHLEAGKWYFLRGAHNEGGGGDHIHIQWRGPGFGWRDISGPVMSSALPIEVVWDDERLVQYEIWNLTAGADDGSSGLNVAPYPGGYPGTNPTIRQFVEEAENSEICAVLRNEGAADFTGFVNTFKLPPSHAASANYFFTRERAVIKIDHPGLYGFGISSDDNGLLYFGPWWDSLTRDLILVAQDDSNHGVRWRSGGEAVELEPGYYGLLAWQYQHSGGAGLSARYHSTETGIVNLGVHNLVSLVDACLHRPLNGAMDVPLDAVLSWEPPFGAVDPQFKVYVWKQGTEQKDGVITTETSFDPDLELATAYWWQVNMLEPNDVTGVVEEVPGKKMAFRTVTPEVVITAHPQGGGVDLNGDFELSVTATSAATPLYYQWKKDGVALGGGDQPTYRISGMTREDNGVYTCVVSNGQEASIESKGARVFLKELMAYWPLDNDLNDYANLLDPAAMGDKHAQYMVNDPNTYDDDVPDTTVPFVPGKVGQGIRFNGVDNFAYAGTWNPTEASGQMTVEFWTQWYGDEGHWAGPIAKRDSWSNTDSMWQIELDNSTDCLKTLQSNQDGTGQPAGGYATIRPPYVGATNVAAGAIISYSAQHTTNRDEAAWRAFDGRYDTKWLAFTNAAWIQATFPDMKKYVVTSYAITSGNDTPGRDPDDWKLKASDDGANWVILDTRTGAAGSWTARNQTVTFDLSSNTTAYRMYRLDISKTSDPSLNAVQLSELELFAAEPIGDDDGWMHVAMTYDGTAATLYINGRRIATENVALAGDTGSSVVFGGTEANPAGGGEVGSKPWGDNLYNGVLDEIKIYNYVRTPQQILQDYGQAVDEDPVCLDGTQPAMDLDGNCVVDLGDLVAFVGQWLLDNSVE